MTTSTPSTHQDPTAPTLKLPQLRRLQLLELHPLAVEHQAPSNLRHPRVVLLQATTSQELHHQQLLQRMLPPRQVPSNVSLAKAAATRHSSAQQDAP